MARNRSIKQIHAALRALDEAPGALDALAAARRVRARAEVLELDLVKAVRKAGYSWADIGALYGMTKQGAQQRFRDGGPARAAGTTRPSKVSGDE